MLLDLGAQLAAANDEGDVPLHEASWAGHEEITEVRRDLGLMLDQQLRRFYSPVARPSTFGDTMERRLCTELLSTIRSPS